MSPDIEFGYNGEIFDPPAAIASIELSSPAFPDDPNPDRISALIDSGADISAIPQVFIDSLRLRKVGEADIGGFDDKEEDYVLETIYSVHLTIPPLKPFIAEVIPKEMQDYATIGRDIINYWVLTLDGPKLKAYLKSIIGSP